MPSSPFAVDGFVSHGHLANWYPGMQTGTSQQQKVE
jgi:hypothetical protein